MFLPRKRSCAWIPRLSALAVPTLVLAAALSCASHAFALDPGKAVTQYGHDAWQSEDGLPKNSVSSVVQTRDGYLWVATQEGLARFDGVRFSPVPAPSPEAPTGKYFSRLLEDRSGGLWIASQGGGLGLYRDGRLSTFGQAELGPGKVLTCVALGRDGTLWIGTYGTGLLRLRDGKCTRITTREGLTSDTIRSVLVDPEGTVWLGTENGLNRILGGRISAFKREDGLPSNDVTALLVDRQGTLWAGTYGGLCRYRNGRWTIFTTREGLSSDMILCLCQDRADTLWVGTYGGGLNRFCDGRFSPFTTKEGLSNDLVLCLTEDREGSLWIGTYGGLDRLKDDKITVFGVPEGLSDDVTWCVYPDRSGALWIGTRTGLNRYRNGHFERFARREGLPDNLVWSVLEDSSGVLWVGTRGGLTRMGKGPARTFTRKDGLTNDAILSLCEDSSGAIWIGTDGGGLNRLSKGRFTAFTMGDGLADNTVMFIHEDRAGDLWVGTRTGLHLFRDGRLANVGVSAVSLYEDERGVFWLGTFGQGIYRYEGGRLDRIDSANGLFDDVAFQILEDRQGYLWCSSNKGIYRVSRNELDECAAGRRKRVSCAAYGKADGMRSSECVGGCQPAGCVAPDGSLWFPTMKGVVRIDPRVIRPNPAPPPVVIEEVTLAGRPIPIQGVIDLGPTRGTMEFRFTALSFLVPRKVLFKVKLEGFDDDWISVGAHRTAVFPRLPPGRYTFRVKACNNDGLWSPEGAALSFRLRPHFYQTLWFYFLCALAALLMGPVFFFIRVRSLKAQQIKLEDLVAVRTGQLEESNRQLEARTGDLQHANLQLEQANELLKRLSYLDGLTGIPNRRHFEDVLDIEWRRGVRTRLPLAVIMVDIDFFKAFNDAYGHQAGDECLKRVAGTLSQSLSRAGDLAARYGGEEFVLILPSTDAEGAAGVAEELRLGVHALAIAHRHSACDSVVTISLGVASAVPDESSAPQLLLAMADQALYAAKQAGRNRVAAS